MLRDNQQIVWRSGCGCCRVTRRGFLAGCAGCALATGTLAVPTKLWGASPKNPGAKVRVVFCRQEQNRPTWPYINYDSKSRERELLSVLRQGCPKVEFLPAVLSGHSVKESGILDRDNEVDGYVVCLLGKDDAYRFEEVCHTGKPTIVADTLFAGSGWFVTRATKLLGKGEPVEWVSSSNNDDLVALAQHFQLAGEGCTADEIVAAIRTTRRQRTPAASDAACLDDPVMPNDMRHVLARLADTRIVVVGRSGRNQFRAATKEVFGLTFVPVAFEELAAAYEVTDADAARAFADEWTDEAQEIVEPSPEEILGSGRMYVAMKDVMKKYDATGISINCLGGFYGGHLKAYPCLGFSQLNNDGLVGGCEADQRSALTMATMGALVERPGFISDPVIDTSKNQIIYAHCVAMTKPFGTGGAANAYRIRSHAEDGNGAAIQSLLPAGYLVTTLEMDPVQQQVLIHQAKTAGNNPSEMACRTKLEANVQGDIEKLTENWRMGWHRVTFYGDLREPVAELCDRLNLQLVEEA